MAVQPTITSAQNPFFRHCLRLRRGRQRRQAGQFLVDGTEEIIKALRANFAIQTVLVGSTPAMDDELARQLRVRPAISLQPLAGALLDRLSYGQLTGQPIALADTPELLLDSLPLTGNSFVLVLDRTEKPGNLGACLRSAAACGVDAVVLTDPLCDPFNANAIRASRGAVFQLPLAVATATQFIERASVAGLPLFAARVEADMSLWQLPLSAGGALVFGNEADGLGETWRQSGVRAFTIPMSSHTDSLNLSISAAVSMYEAVRQRTARKFD